MRRKRDIVVWHRLMGVTLADVLPSSLLGVEAEREVSVKRQFLDIVIVRKRPGEISEPLPDGLDDLAQHNLVTYKSQHQALDAWAIEELIGHMVSYRKLVSPSPVKLLPREQFQMYGISTRYPEKLRSEVKLEERQPGVHELALGTGSKVRILVLAEMPDAPRNAVWKIFSGKAEKVKAALNEYEPRTPEFGLVRSALVSHYGIGDAEMSYTVEDFKKDFIRHNLDVLPPEERLRGMSPEDRLRGMSPEERLRGMSPEELTSRLSLEERLRGMSPDDIEAFVRREKHRRGKTQKD